MPILERARRAGCIASGAASLALFFAIGAIVSLLAGDVLMVLQSLVVAALLFGAAIWIARVHRKRIR